MKNVLYRGNNLGRKKKRLDKKSTMVSTMKVSAYICLKYVQSVKKTVGVLRNNNSKPIDIFHD